MEIQLHFECRLDFEVIRSVRRETVCVGGRTVEYRLLAFEGAAETFFCISAAGDGECTACVLCPAVNANKAFETIFSGGCAPCTLRDVVDDMSYETIY